MFRCCLPCRGGSKAPATSHPSTPSGSSDQSSHGHQVQFVSVVEGGLLTSTSTTTGGGGQGPPSPAVKEEKSLQTKETKTTTEGGDAIKDEATFPGQKEDSKQERQEEKEKCDLGEEGDFIISVPLAVVQRLCQSVSSSNQQSPLPHIVEEEEVNVQVLSSPDPLAIRTSSGSTTASSSSANNLNLSEREDLVGKLLDHRYVVPEEFSSPSPPRTKHNSSGSVSSGHWGSKQPHKGRTRSVTSTTSSETITSGNGASGTKSDSVISGSSLAGHHHSNHHQQPSSGSFLVPKMQAEQGSIGELQKYHNRYLKNRRHTLANVR